jgi:hypothetical protein
MSGDKEVNRFGVDGEILIITFLQGSGTLKQTTVYCEPGFSGFNNKK